MTLGNAPRQRLTIPLLARSSYALGVKLLNRKDKSPVNVTGGNLRMVARSSKRLGSQVVYDENAALIGDATLGTMQFAIQSSDLDIAPGEYSFTMVFTSVNEYTTPVCAGTWQVRENDDLAVGSDFPALMPDTTLAAYFENGDVLEVHIDKVDGPESVISVMLSEAGALATAAEVAASSAVSFSEDAQSWAEQAQTAAGAVVASADAAAASASAAADSASDAEGAKNTAVAAAGASATSSTEAEGFADMAMRGAGLAGEQLEQAAAILVQMEEIGGITEFLDILANGDFTLNGIWDFTDATVIGVSGGGGGGTLLEDPSDEGTYIVAGSGLVEDPSDEGTYLVGA